MTPRLAQALVDPGTISAITTGLNLLEDIVGPVNEATTAAETAAALRDLISTLDDEETSSPGENAIGDRVRELEQLGYDAKWTSEDIDAYLTDERRAERSMAYNVRFLSRLLHQLKRLSRYVSPSAQERTNETEQTGLLRQQLKTENEILYGDTSERIEEKKVRIQRAVESRRQLERAVSFMNRASGCGR